MLDTMKRSAIHTLARAGQNKTQIAESLGVHRDTVSQALKEPCDKRYSRKRKGSAVDPFAEQIRQWIEAKVPVRRMLEMAQADPEKPYQGSRAVFYKQVNVVRQARAQENIEAIVRFEGLPGEFVQVDWGEVRRFPFATAAQDTRYFFCARLKYSRFMYVEFTANMQLETLVRCHLRAFESFGGIACMAVYDNMKTVTLGRDEANRPIFNETFAKFAVEMQFYPVVCSPQAGQQKGAVESLVKFVKTNFLPGRTFVDDADLATQCTAWLETVNGQVSQANERRPVDLLPDELVRMLPVPCASGTYGLYDVASVGPDSTVLFDTNRYSVPVRYVGRTLAVRVTETEVLAFDNAQEVARHPRERGRKQRSIVVAHLEPAVANKPRGRAMLYRTHLLGLHPAIYEYVAQVCRRHVAQMDQQVVKLYRLWEQYGTEEFLAAVELAGECGTFAAEYLEALLAVPRSQRKIVPLRLPGVPEQQQVDRQLSGYETYVR